MIYRVDSQTGQLRHWLLPANHGAQTKTLRKNYRHKHSRFYGGKTCFGSRLLRIFRRYFGMFADKNCHRSTNAKASRLIIGPACMRIYDLWRLAGLESYGLTKTLLTGGDPAANPAKKPGVLHKGLVLPGAADLKTEIVQITKVLVVAGVRHTCLCHRIDLHHKSYAVSFYPSALRCCIIAKPSTAKRIMAEVSLTTGGSIQV